MTTQHATFAAGCFWGVEADFLQLPGVTNVTSGYTGGHVDNPTYHHVCSGRTGHAEAVLVEFNPEQISFQRLVDAFFAMHDPTQLNRQGPDRGTQYRSAIFWHSSEQKEIAEQQVTDLQGEYRKPIVTEITEASTFWPAEEYHQRFYEKHGMIGCKIS